ncbi:hypothetical protein LSTR_LSTR007485 [Laodelphax striatellus]|uniref:Uncharacterized protein n=1 Tax=Laodelphax striatellus TaxID=195883 RepID=A0A482X4J5_LAOST|nr:hypothetical protein LSTR_LSTR007485 [Laodelphax striatellus]
MLPPGRAVPLPPLLKEEPSVIVPTTMTATETARLERDQQQVASVRYMYASISNQSGVSTEAQCAIIVGIINQSPNRNSTICLVHREAFNFSWWSRDRLKLVCSEAGREQACG